jgi:ABC-2 type transport system ATP-binding protein
LGWAVEARGLRKSYSVREGGLVGGRRVRVEALRGVSFRVGWGEVYGLLGPNGAGKTTTVKIVATLLEPDEGDALVAGYSSVREPLRVRERIGVMLSVERGFFWKLTGRENLMYFGMLYGLEGRELEERVDGLLELTGLRGLGGDRKRFEDMSLGMRARLGLARALLRDPPVLILDEPTLGLDPPSARMVRGLLRRLAGEGKAVLLTTHNMFEAEIVCDRVGIISGGRVVAEGAPGELKARIRGRVPVVLRLRGEEERIEELARRLGGSVSRLAPRDGGARAVRVVADPEDTERVVERAVGEALRLGLRLVEARVEEPTLEDVFIALTGGGGGDGG